MERSRADSLPVADVPVAVAPARPGRRGWPRLQADLLTAVFVGGGIGGALRYAITSRWHTDRGGFPWATFAINLTGAFVLAVVVVVAVEYAPSRWFRPLVGTGFCGGFTTFSSVVVSAAELLAHGGAGTGVAYLAASAVGGLVSAFAGLVVGRAATRPRRAAGGIVGGAKR